MSSSLVHKLDLLLSLVHDHGARLRRLEEKIEPGVAKFSKYVSCSQLGQMVGLQGRTITKYINRGKFPKEILKKKVLEVAEVLKIENKRSSSFFSNNNFEKDLKESSSTYDSKF